jgi:hypothetical protein
MKTHLIANLLRSSAVAVPLLLLQHAHAAGQSSANFAIPRDTLNAGVADMASANFAIRSSLGDSVAGGSLASVGFQISGGFRGSVNAPAAVLNLLSVFSRKLHNGVPFDITIDHTQPITGTLSIEPRAIGGGHTIIFRFDGPISAAGAATALDQAMNTAATVTLSRNNNDVIATLSNVADSKRLTLRLTGVNNTATAEASLGFLVGDVNATGRVNAADIAALKANLTQAVNSNARAKFDLNADGSITSSDVSAAKARAGVSMP